MYQCGYVSLSLYSYCPGFDSGGRVHAGEDGHWRAVWPLHLGSHKRATLNKKMHLCSQRSHFQHVLLLSFSIISLLTILLSLSLIYTSSDTHLHKHITEAGTIWDFDFLKWEGLKFVQAAYLWIFLQFCSLMFKEVVQIKVTCTNDWFYFITVLLIVVVVVVFILKGDALLYGFVMINIVTLTGRLHAVALRACFWDRISIYFL